MESINIDTEWPSHYQLPDPGNMMESHSRRKEVFANQGTSIANAILSCYSKYGPNRPFSENIILDFGCGVGRVVLPLCYTLENLITASMSTTAQLHIFAALFPQPIQVSAYLNLPFHFPMNHSILFIVFPSGLICLLIQLISGYWKLTEYFAQVD